MLLKLNAIDAGYNHTTVLHNVKLEVNENDFVGIIGPNGGGKTTLLKVILGLLPVFKGQMVRSEDLKIGYLPQINNIDKQFPVTIEEVILSGQFAASKWWHRSGKIERKTLDELLEFIDLREYKNTTIGELSGGQLQRVLLCRALISQPNLFILDEPNTFVDKGFEESLYRHLSHLNKEMAILLVSHDVGTISSFVKTIACVNGQLHYHPSNKITDEILQSYDCPIELISHGKVPHRVLKHHQHE